MNDLYVRGLIVARWLSKTNNFDGVSSEALTIDLSCEGKELSVYEYNESKECLDMVAIKLFIDKTKYFEDGLALFVLKNKDLKMMNFDLKSPSDKDEIFFTKHFNVVNVDTVENVLDIGKYIYKNIWQPDAFVEYDADEIFQLMYLHRHLCKKYKLFNDKIGVFKKIFRKFEDKEEYKALFAKNNC